MNETWSLETALGRQQQKQGPLQAVSGLLQKDIPIIEKMPKAGPYRKRARTPPGPPEYETTPEEVYETLNNRASAVKARQAALRTKAEQLL